MDTQEVADVVTQGTVLATAIVGLLAPAITSAVNRPAWSSQRKQLVALGVSVVLGVAALALTGALDSVSSVAVGVLAVVGVSQATYSLLYKPTGAGAAIERATSGAADPPEEESPAPEAPLN